MQLYPVWEMIKKSRKKIETLNMRCIFDDLYDCLMCGFYFFIWCNSVNVIEHLTASFFFSNQTLITNYIFNELTLKSRINCFVTSLPTVSHE